MSDLIAVDCAEHGETRGWRCRVCGMVWDTDCCPAEPCYCLDADDDPRADKPYKPYAYGVAL